MATAPISTLQLYSETRSPFLILIAATAHAWIHNRLLEPFPAMQNTIAVNSLCVNILMERC